MNTTHELLQAQLDQAGLGDGWQTEVRFLPPRRWRFDFAHPTHRIAVEIHGGIHTQGRHTRGKSFERDREKMNAAQLAGWTVLEFTTDHVTRTEYALNTIRAALREA